MGQAMGEAVEEAGQVVERIIEETDQLLHFQKTKKKKKVRKRGGERDM